MENEGIDREQLVDSGLKFIRRSAGPDSYYFIVNHSPETVNQKISLSISVKNILIMDPLSGEIGKAESQQHEKFTDVQFNLESGESLILRATNLDPQNIPNWNYSNNQVSHIKIEGPWILTFDPEGGPETPESTQLDEIAPWTNLADPKASFYSGRGTYSSDFDFRVEENKSYLLTFEKIHESAKVWINDQYAGQVWSLPYKLDISKNLKDGQNQIRIEVANLMANHIRYLDQKAIPWRNYHEINFVNIDYKSFDASEWKVMPSGISGEVRIISYE